MNPIRELSSIQIGDVLYHAQLGFAVVDDIDEAGAGLALAWENTGTEAPVRVPAAQVIEEFSQCIPAGFMTRSMVDAPALADLVALDPARALRLLLDDLGEPLGEEETKRWLVGRDLLPEVDYERWWRALRKSMADMPVFSWRGGRVSYVALTPTDSTSVSAWLTASPRQRLDLLDRVPPENRMPMLEASVKAGDIDGALTLLRGWKPLPNAALSLLRALVRGGEARVAAALLARGQSEQLDDFAELAAAEEGRALLEDALGRLPLGQRTRVLDALHARAESGSAPEAAERFLNSLSLEPSAPRFRPSLREEQTEEIDDVFPMHDSTVEMSVEPGSVLLSMVAPLPAHRILPTSLALARALAVRHAMGQAGGLLGARLKAGGAVELGAPEDSDPVTDVRDAMRLIAEIAIGRRPAGVIVDDEHVLTHLPLLVPGAPLDWMTVATRAMAPEPELRPADGLDLWVQLERAAATDRVRASAPPRPDRRAKVSHDTHIGMLKSRLGQVNQDAVFWFSEGPSSLLIVADGISVSTAGSGDLASSILVRVMVALWEQHQERLRGASTEEIRAFLDSALATANQAICNASMRLAGGDLTQHIPMGTTVLVALMIGATVHLATLGDSRAFLISSGGAALLNGDQNVRGEWLLSWQRGRPADLMGDGHALTGYCGHFNDRLQPEAVPPAHRTLILLPGETLALCTDGFTDYAADSLAGAARLIEKAAAGSDLGEACRTLVSQANARGGGDNITVLLARIEG